MFKRVLIAMATLLVTTAAGVPPTSAEPAAPRSADAPAGWHRVMNQNSGLCLAIGGGNAYPGVAAIQWTCNGQPEQRWYVTGDEWSPIKYNSELCLAIGGGSHVSGARAILWTCNDRPEQLWHVGGQGFVSVVNYNSRKCLAIGGGSATPGAVAIQWTCNYGPEQRWRFLSIV